MKKILLPLLLITLLTTVSTQAQNRVNGSISGKLLDAKGKQPVEYAVVSVTSAADSSAVGQSMTDKQGSFAVRNLSAGNYRLLISFVGFQTYRKSFAITAAEPNLNLGDVLFQEGVELKEVLVQGEKLPVTIKKDTVEFNAGSFKTRTDATTEELLKKLPGVQIDKDGNITAQGERVTRLTVDGKDFFGTDPKTATKNLPADAIDKIQLVDSKTEAAKQTGVDDGQREKVLNLTIKKDKKKGWFGNASVTGGTTERYNGYLSANRFQQDKQFAVLMMSNNTNNSNFNWEDLRSFAGGDVGSIFAPPGGGSFSINVDRRGNTNIGGSGVFDNAGQGLVNTHSGGMNFSDSWGKKNELKVTGSYFGYFSEGDQQRFSNAQNFSSTDLLRTVENNNSITNSQAHRLNLRMEYKPDSLTDINFRPNVILNFNEANSRRLFTSSYDAVGKVNDGNQRYTQNTSTPALYGEFSALRRLGKDKGSVSIRLNGSYSHQSTDWRNLYLLNTYANGGATVNNINQDAEQQSITRGYSLNGNYSRPITKTWSANLQYTYGRNANDADQATYEYNPVTDRYEVLVPSLTNEFNSQNWNHSQRLGFVYNKKAWNVNFGVGLQESTLTGYSLSNNAQDVASIRKDFVNVLPRFSINFRPENNRTLTLNYNSSLNLPSVTNLQPVLNNTNPLYKRSGNPDLEPAKNHRLTLNFNKFKPGTDIYWNGYMAYNMTFDGFSTDTRINGGEQLVKPINVDGNYSINAGTNFGMPAKVKGLRFNFGIFGSINHTKNFINTVDNETDRYNVGPYAAVIYDYKETLNIFLSTSVGYNKVNNQVQAASNQRYLNFDNGLTLSWELIKDLRILSDINHYGFAGRADGFNQNFMLWNAGIEKFVYNRKFSIALKGNDILKQNTNISRSVDSGRIEDVRFNNLTRYFSMALTYRLAKVGGNGGRENPRTTVN